MKVKLLKPIDIDVALFGLGKNKGITSEINFRDFIKLQNFRVIDDDVIGEYSKE